MRRSALWLAAFGLICAPIFAQENGVKPPHEVLTIEGSLDRAYRNNPRLLESQRDLALAKISTKQAKSLFYPKINLNLNYVRFRNETLGITSPEMGNIILEAPLENAAGVRANPLAENLYLGRIGFVQTLFAGGRLNYTYKLSKANVSQSETDYEALKRKVQFDTTQAFGSLLALREKKLLLDAALQEADRMGGMGHGGLLALQTRRDLRKKLSAQAKESRDVMYDYLETLGLELFSDVEVSGTLDVEPLALDPKTVLVWAKQNRTELKQTQLQAEVDQLAVNLALSERYPVFLLGGGVEMRNSELPIDETNWNTALTMNIPLFDGISIPTRIRESRHKAERGRLRRVQLEDQVEREVRSAFDDYGHWKDELAVRQEEVKKLDRLRSDYQSAGIRERLEYLNWRLKAKTDVVDAQYALYIAKASLEQAVGRPLE